MPSDGPHTINMASVYPLSLCLSTAHTQFLFICIPSLPTIHVFILSTLELCYVQTSNIISAKTRMREGMYSQNDQVPPGAHTTKLQRTAVRSLVSNNFGTPLLIILPCYAPTGKKWQNHVAPTPNIIGI